MHQLRHFGKNDISGEVADEGKARGIAVNFAKMPELLNQRERQGGDV
jgi:hypothetical protein